MGKIISVNFSIKKQSSIIKNDYTQTTLTRIAKTIKKRRDIYAIIAERLRSSNTAIRCKKSGR